MILEAGIAMSPGSSFGENGEGYVRFSMIQNQDQINQASTRLKHFFSFKI
jgi:alanine-synthesizing transaminase